MRLSQLNLNIYTGWQFEFGQSVYRLRCRCINLDKTLVCAELKLLTGFLIHMRRAQYCEYFLFRGQRNRTGYHRSTRTHRLNDLLR